MYQDKDQDIPTTTAPTGPSAPLDLSTKVYVRNRFLGDWSSGFDVIEILGDRYRLRRLSDGQVFADVFSFDDVLLERRQHPRRGVDESWLDRHRP